MATKFLLWCGVWAGPFYLAVGIAQALLRDGFVFSKHPLSVLTNGPGGWIQTVNFVVTGLMVLAAAVGFRRVLGPKPRMTWFLGAYGAAMLAAAMFRADPMDGFPPGTPLGVPTTMSTTGLLHFAAGGVGFVCLAVSCFLAAREMRRRNAASLARLSLGSGLIVVVGFFGGAVLPIGGVLGIWLAVVVGWAWLTIMSLRIQRLP